VTVIFIEIGIDEIDIGQAAPLRQPFSCRVFVG
jgi:hypothetical protein